VRDKIRRTLRWAEHVLASIGLFFVIYFVGFDLSYMVTGSMAPTLQGGDGMPSDWILTVKVFLKPDRWEVLTFRDREGNRLMKRVVGLPGETVSLPDVGQLTIDGKRIEPSPELSFLKYLPAGNLMDGKSVRTDGGWYVLGDYVRDSLDSRFDGPVPKSRIVGKAWLRIWPLSRFGLVR
jgi:signal peptidase I